MPNQKPTLSWPPLPSKNVPLSSIKLPLLEVGERGESKVDVIRSWKSLYTFVLATADISVTFLFSFPTAGME